MKKDRKALAYFQEALNISTEINKPYEKVVSMLNLAGAYLTFGQFKNAYDWIKRAEALHSTLPHENRGIVRDIEYLYSKYYQAVGNWKAALEHTKKLHELEKVNFISDREGAVTRLGMEYESEKKEAQLASQRKELVLKNENLRTQQWLLLAAAALLLLAVGAVAVYYRLYRQKQRLSRHNAELVDEQNHRVKNNLQVVSGLLQLQINRLADPATIAAVKDTQSRIEVMAVLQRKLYDVSRTTASRASEFIREVVGTSLKSFSCEHIEPDSTIPDNIALAPDYALAVGLIVNELTTNACKYAFPDHPAPKLSIEVRMERSDFHLRLSDNGAGFAMSPNVNGRKSLGLKIIQLQVAQLNGEYHFDTSNGTAFQMSFKV